MAGCPGIHHFALSKPFFYFANSWGTIAGCALGRPGRKRDSNRSRGMHWWQIPFRRVNAGLLLVSSCSRYSRCHAGSGNRTFDHLAGAKAIRCAFGCTFRTIVLISIIPAFLAVLTLILGTKDIKKRRNGSNAKIWL